MPNHANVNYVDKTQKIEKPVLDNDREKEEIIEDLLTPPISKVKSETSGKASVMDLATTKRPKKRRSIAQNKPSPNEQYHTDLTYNPKFLTYYIQNKYDQHVAEELKKISKKELEIELCIRDASYLSKEFMAIRDSMKNSKTVNLDEYKEEIEKFNRKHFSRIQEDNKSIVTDDQNPFHGNLDLQNISKKDIEQIIDKLDEVITKERNALSHLTFKLRRVTEAHTQISYLNAQAAAKTKEDDVMVRNQITGRQ